ncbi:MAG: transporter substrate-binding domain-containing protein [Lachnospiraceae bacterium]|nr:transporter substrate-binding domain-containing protein [Lachnospiraceae bacterium]MDE7273049.1 transporter substrate-binding domain-containing protein [Lachnospiraceae bacterium]
MKKATKTAAMLLAVTMMAAALTACGNSADTSAGNNAEADTTAEVQTQNAEAGTESAAPETGGTLTFGTNAEFPPFEYVTSSGVIDQYDGIDIAIAKQIAEKNGMTAAIENMEFDSLLVALQNGQIDAAIAGMSVTEDRAEEADFSIPYYTATQVMIVKEDSDIASASDMADKKICVIQGYTGEICVKDMGYPYEAFKKGTDAIMELVNGKCDVVVLDSATSQKYVSDNEGLKIVEDASAFESEVYAIAVKKGNTELLDKINQVIDAMLSDGTIAELGAQYIEALSAE